MLFSKEKFLAINKLKGKEKTEINLNIKENKLMEKCREYVCKDNKNVQKKSNYEWDKVDKNTTNNCSKESHNQWGYNPITGEEKKSDEEIKSPKQQDKKDFSERDSLSVINLSGGKDSTALLILMIEKELPIDIVINADPWMEFPEMYEHLERVDEYLYRERGIHITTLRHPKGFEWMMFEEPKKRSSAIQKRIEMGVSLYGNGWPGIKVRWCTGQLKIKLIDAEIRRLKTGKRVLDYIGIAADEAQRCKEKRYPLVEWGITEEKALQICYDHGFDFGGLYEKYHRASCWCCPFQRISGLRNLRKYHPQLWKRLIEMDQRAKGQFGSGALGQFKQRWSIEGLENRFAQEEKPRLILP